MISDAAHSGGKPHSYFLSPTVRVGSVLLGFAAVDVVPERLVATRLDPSGAARYTRPVCEYGTFPKYAGTGDSNSAASYACIPTGGR